MARTKLCSAEEAAALVQPGDCITVSGTIHMMLPQTLLRAIEMRFLTEGSPRDLTWFEPFPTGIPGIEPLSHEGLIKRVIGGWFTPHPALRDLILANKVEAYLYPLGTLAFNCQQMAAGRKGFLTNVGLDTYLDPRVGGARLNACTTEELVSVTEIDGDEYLWYKTVPITVALLRGTVADEEGNFSIQNESITMSVLNQALAARANGGTVIVQVENVVKAGTIPPRQVAVPGILVDAIVVDAQPDGDANDPATAVLGVSWLHQLDPIRTPPKEVMLSLDPECWRIWAQEGRVDPERAVPARALVNDALIGRRAVQEMHTGEIYNIGQGLPARDIVPAAVEEETDTDVVLSMEPGQFGGNFNGGGWRSGVTSILDTPSIFSFYEAGNIKASFLSMLEFDAEGNVNLLRYGDTLVGPGGSMDIGHGAPKIVFNGTFRAVGLEARGVGGRLEIIHEGAVPRAVARVQAICFNGRRMLQAGKEVLYVTARAVFRLTEAGPELIEIAPGIDLEQDVLAKMDFRPRIAADLRTMDPRIFRSGPIGLRQDWEADGTGTPRTASAASAASATGAAR